MMMMMMMSSVRPYYASSCEMCKICDMIYDKSVIENLTEGEKMRSKKFVH